MPCVQNDPAKTAQREYMREWRKKNPEKVKAAQQRYWNKRGEKMNLEQADSTDPEQNTGNDE